MVRPSTSRRRPPSVPPLPAASETIRTFPKSTKTRNCSCPSAAAYALHGEQRLLRAHDRDRAMQLEIARVHGTRFLDLEAQDSLVHLRREHQGELLQPLNDLMDVFDHTGNRLVFVHDAVDPKCPD